jgi:hypothetical protein
MGKEKEKGGKKNHTHTLIKMKEKKSRRGSPKIEKITNWIILAFPCI